MDELTLALFEKLEKRIRDVDLRQGGPRGPKGRKGDKGDVGPKGSTGAQGPRGPEGKRGSEGPQGPVGARGPKGDSLVGPKGERGPQGSQGSQGPQGPKGDQGVSVTDAQIDFDGSLTLYMSDGTTIDAGSVTVGEGDGNITYIRNGSSSAGKDFTPEIKDLQNQIDQIVSDLNDHINDVNNPHSTSVANLTDTSITNAELGDGLFYREGKWINRVPFNEAWPSGLGDGGELNIGPGTNDIEVLAGIGALTDTYTSPLSPPVVQGIQWPQINAPITAAPPVAGSVVWFSIADTGIPSTPIGSVPINLGELRQYAQPPNPSLSRRELFLGLAVHNGDEWKEISNPKVINQAAETLREVATVVLPFSSIVSGGSTREIGTFQVEQDEGVVWENNRNWHNDKSDPNREVLPAQSPVTFKYVTRDFSFVSAATDTFDPETYDVGGTPTPVPGGGNTTTIQRLYVDPANNYWCLYGQETYSNFFTAEANLGADLARTELPFILQNSILLGSAVMEQGKNNWDPNEAVWIPAGGSAGTGGGGGTPITDHNNLNGIGPDDHHPQVHAFTGPDHTGVTVTSPVTGQALIWSGTEWVNDDVAFDIFAGPGTTGYVPDPVTGSGRFLTDAGTWTDTIDGGTF